jgi:RNA-directed DNA polymerase
MENPKSKDSLERQESEVPSGSTLDRGMSVKKRRNDRPEEDGTLNSGGPEFISEETIHLHGAASDRPSGGLGGKHRESDQPIVVRDGKADHMAKELAQRHRGHSTHAGERITPTTSVSRTLSALRAKAEEDPEHRFRSLARLLDHELLSEAFHHLKRKASPGIDGVTHASYGENLERNLVDLEKRLKQGRYRARSVKRKWILKAGGRKLRPLGIPVLEDKIVQQAVKMILESIWEADFYDESVGYRPGKGARQSSLDLRETLNVGNYRWIVEADIRGFFDHMDHDWLVRMLEERIADRSLIALIIKWLKAGVMEEGRVEHPATGTPQGGVISPILANIYLHFVQDHWIKRVVAPRSKGGVHFMRYADDSIVCFENENDARAYLQALPKRLEKFSLQLAEEKSSLVRFERWNPEQSGRFTFLGFDFHWARSRRHKHYAYVKRVTNKEKFRASLLAFKEWIKRSRSVKLPDLLVVLRRKLRGYWNYYGVRGNSRMLAKYDLKAKQILFKWLNRRSQRRSMTWTQFGERLKHWDLPLPRIVEKPVRVNLPSERKPA